MSKPVYSSNIVNTNITSDTFYTIAFPLAPKSPTSRKLPRKLEATWLEPYAESLLKNTDSLSYVQEPKSKIFELWNSAGNIHKENGRDMENLLTLEGINFIKENHVPLATLWGCVKNNDNIAKIFYFNETKDFWILVNSKEYSEYKKIVTSCVAFDEAYPNYSYLILTEEQIIKEEMPRPDAALVR